MILSSEQLAVVRKYTDAYRIDQDKLVAYLQKHRTIKLEVFSYCSKVSKRSMGSRGYSVFLNESTYSAVDRDTFMRRIPFYFFQVPFGGDTRTGLSKVFPSDRKKTMTAEDCEAFYTDLEWMFYDLHLPLTSIYDYLGDQFTTPSLENKRGRFGSFLTSSILEECGLSGREAFPMWRHYLHLCQELGWTDYTPQRFISAYNFALEASGLDPILYRPLKDYIITYYTRIDDTYVFRGNFPCDKNGVPIMRWTTVRVQNAASIEFSGEKSRCGELRILLGPKTRIHIREFYENEDDGTEIDRSSVEFIEEPLMWRQIYAGPQTMEFNHNALKQARIEHKLKQSDVAFAIGTSVRTYQKWESGETIPDGHNLLRLMNWLNISDPQELVIYDDYSDE